MTHSCYRNTLDCPITSQYVKYSYISKDIDRTILCQQISHTYKSIYKNDSLDY